MAIVARVINPHRKIGLRMIVAPFALAAFLSKCKNPSWAVQELSQSGFSLTGCRGMLPCSAVQEITNMANQFADHPSDTSSAETKEAVPSRRGFRAFVEIASGTREGTVCELLKGRVVIGRHTDCDIVLDSVCASKHHAQFVREEDGFALEDLGSCNGSYVNGVVVRKRVRLRSGDRIHLGDVILVYRC
jgi:hypothetical protein